MGSKVIHYIEVAELLLDIYNAYTKRILKKMNDPYLQALTIISYRTIDLKQILDAMKNLKEEYYKALSNGYTEESYYLFQKIKKYLEEFETKIIERLIEMVKIYAIYLAKSSFNND